jgi:DNA-directed RNA polymerase subunit RPC12/RpoP
MKTHTRTQRPRIAGALNTFGDFVCMSCHNFVSADSLFSNVQNRNHCPYCLSSRHLDLYQAGDRLSACKARMRPVALTLKKTAKKYASAHSGEMMLVHICDDCGKFSVNRIAADDDNAALYEIFEASARLDAHIESMLLQHEIVILKPAERSFVSRQLHGNKE